MKHVQFGRFTFQQSPHRYIIEVQRGNDYGKPSYPAEIVCETKEELIDELNNLDYYDTLLRVREGTDYEVDWDEMYKEDEDDDALL